MSDLKAMVDEKIKNKKVMMFSKSGCPFCSKAKNALSKYNLNADEYEVMELDRRDDGSAIQKILATITGGSTVPRVFIHGKFIGGGDETAAMDRSGELKKMLASS